MAEKGRGVGLWGGRKVYKNSLYFPLNLSINQRLLFKKKKKKVYELKKREDASMPKTFIRVPENSS